MAGDGQPGLPRRRDPDLAGLATFALDAHGRVTLWSVTATRLFGHLAAAVLEPGEIGGETTGGRRHRGRESDRDEAGDLPAHGAIVTLAR